MSMRDYVRGSVSLEDSIELKHVGIGEKGILGGDDTAAGKLVWQNSSYSYLGKVQGALSDVVE